MSTQSRLAAVAAALLFILFAPGCSSSTEPGTVQEFPNAVGDSWTYAVYDTIDTIGGVPPSIDTARVRVVLRTYTVSRGEPPDTALESRPAMVWEIELRGHVDSLLVIRHTNSVELNPMRADGRWLVRYLRFPLATGSSWTISGITDVVAGHGSVTLPAGVFSDAYTIEGSADRMRSTVWYQNGVGVLAMNRSLQNGTSWTSERWELVRYELR